MKVQKLIFTRNSPTSAQAYTSLADLKDLVCHNYWSLSNEEVLIRKQPSKIYEFSLLFSMLFYVLFGLTVDSHRLLIIIFPSIFHYRNTGDGQTLSSTCKSPYFHSYRRTTSKIFSFFLFSLLFFSFSNNQANIFLICFFQQF